MDRGHAACGMTTIGLNRFAVCSGSRFREQPGFQSNPSLLPPERRCEEEGNVVCDTNPSRKGAFQ